jgi:adenylate cyclase
VAGEKKQVTVFFSDIAGFTPIGERLSSVGVVRLINEYLSLASAPIIENHGVIDKYIGDEVMAFWCTPFVEAGEEARLACRAALAQFEQLEILRERLPDVTGLRKDLPEVHIRVGLASGEALVGSIGSDYARNFTAMGDTVNLGSRLEGANKVYGTRILICEQTRTAAGDAVETREIDWITVAGKREPLRVFELLSPAGRLSPARERARTAFEAALSAYRARDWPAAEAGFTACLDHDRDDGPARVFRERVARLRTAPPADDWDGVWRLSGKGGI